jgi:hypothetical protein
LTDKNFHVQLNFCAPQFLHLKGGEIRTSLIVATRTKLLFSICAFSLSLDANKAAFIGAAEPIFFALQANRDRYAVDH